MSQHPQITNVVIKLPCTILGLCFQNINYITAQYSRIFQLKNKSFSTLTKIDPGLSALLPLPQPVEGRPHPGMPQTAPTAALQTSRLGSRNASVPTSGGVSQPSDPHLLREAASSSPMHSGQFLSALPPYPQLWALYSRHPAKSRARGGPGLPPAPQALASLLIHTLGMSGRGPRPSLSHFRFLCILS